MPRYNLYINIWVINYIFWLISFGVYKNMFILVFIKFSYESQKPRSYAVATLLHSNSKYAL
jgi:hypothetical protein